MKTSLQAIITWTLGTLVVASAPQLSASPLLIDRGLPTANLNDAGGSRSNYSWLFPKPAADATDYWLVGDSFTNSSPGIYSIDTIRLWTVGAAADLTSAILWGGIQGSTITLLGSAASKTEIYYLGGVAYSSGPLLLPLTQIDFGVGILLGPGQTYDFFLDGADASSPDFLPYVHASNAALSGSSQDGADGLMRWAYVSSGTIAAGDVGTWTSNDGILLDKVTDVNVQVFGTASVPDGGSTLLLIGLALAGMGPLMHRTRRT